MKTAFILVLLAACADRAAAIEKRTLARDDHIYSAFPDIARTRSGTLVLIYRECMGHGPFPFSRLVVRRSRDEGRTWSGKKHLLETVATPEAVERARPWLEADALAGYAETKGRITAPWQVGASINCPRLLHLADGTLFLVADIRLAGGGSGPRWVMKMWRSSDDGNTWTAPVDLRLTEHGLVPQLAQLKDGRILLGMMVEEEGKDRLFFQGVTFSSDGGATWSKVHHLPRKVGEMEIDETSFVELDDGTLVGFGRNYALEKQRRPSVGLKVISKDGGATWQGPLETWLLGCEGRPKAGRLRSGEIAVTYRFDSPNEMLAMHVMTQAAAKLESPSELIEREPFPEDIPARLAKERGDKRPWYMTSYYAGRTLVLDVDRSVHRDAGYSGWVQLSSGDVFVVDYVNDDAPLAQIRGYVVRRSDYILFPDGDLPWLHPSGQPFRAITHALSERQMEKNRRQGAKP